MLEKKTPWQKKTKWQKIDTHGRKPKLNGRK